MIGARRSPATVEAPEGTGTPSARRAPVLPVSSSGDETVPTPPPGVLIRDICEYVVVHIDHGVVTKYQDGIAVAVENRNHGGKEVRLPQVVMIQDGYILATRAGRARPVRPSTCRTKG